MNLDLIKRFEGCRLTAYLDAVRIPTIGYGSTQYGDGRPVCMGDTITQEQADVLLADHVSKLEDELKSCITAPLSDNQLESIVSLAYNIGIGAFQHSTLLKKLNAGDYQGAADEFLRWNKAGGHVLPGLVARRAAERELFLFMKILRWLALLLPSLAMTVLAMILAPILPLFAWGAVLPGWLAWFQTPDNTLDGDSGHRARWPSNAPLDIYKRRVAWLWRNPAYGFSKAIGAPFNEALTVTGDPDVGDRPYHAGYNLRTIPGGWFRFEWVSPPVAGYGLRVLAGWMLTPLNSPTYGMYLFTIAVRKA